MTASPFPPELVATREELHRIAVHVVARAREQSAGRFGLRIAPGGFAVPALGDEVRRVRVSGDVLVVEQAAPGSAAMSARAIHGSSLRELAAMAAVDLDAPLSVGHDTPPLGDPDRPIAIDRAAAMALAAWLGDAATALDRVVAALGPGATPTVVQLWPEHFDVAVDVEAAPGVRVNLGAAAGDAGEVQPYAYVGPWTTDRPGDDGFWNASFGAVLAGASVAAERDPVDRLARFFRAGVDRFAGSGQPTQ
jgi:hypothetical protein